MVYTKKDIIRFITEKLKKQNIYKIQYKETEQITNLFLWGLKLFLENLEPGDEFIVRHIGKFKCDIAPGRLVRNPRTGEPVDLPERPRIKFYPSKLLTGKLAKK